MSKEFQDCLANKIWNYEDVFARQPGGNPIKDCYWNEVKSGGEFMLHETVQFEIDVKEVAAPGGAQRAYVHWVPAEMDADTFVVNKPKQPKPIDSSGYVYGNFTGRRPPGSR